MPYLSTVLNYVCSLHKVCYQSFHLFLQMQQVCFPERLLPSTVPDVWFGQVNELLPASLPCDRRFSYWWVWCVEVFPFFEVKGSIPGVQDKGFCSFSSYCCCNSSVLVMHSKAQRFSMWQSRPECLLWKPSLLQLQWQMMECSGGYPNLNLCDPMFCVYKQKVAFIRWQKL